MTITHQMLDTDLQSWFINAKNAEHAKEEILSVFSEEPGDGYIWSAQDTSGVSILTRLPKPHSHEKNCSLISTSVVTTKCDLSAFV